MRTRHTRIPQDQRHRNRRIRQSADLEHEWDTNKILPGKFSNPIQLNGVQRKGYGTNNE